jgi:DNA recombination protein Rad52
MSFSEPQIKLLSSKLNGKHVRTRELRGRTLSYIEGWHVIAEANRIFGFDGWDRETAWAECIWAEAKREPRMCAYAARVRIRVRAGETIICREGSGVGHGSGATLGEAHESALKEAETDAMKRALATFGNLFGLALYDKEQNGVRRSSNNKSVAGQAVAWTLLSAAGQPVSAHDNPQSFCAAMRELLAVIPSLEELQALWARNATTMIQLRAILPDLKTAQGMHYADILEKLCEQHAVRLAGLSKQEKPVADIGGPASVFLLPHPRRIRDASHLQFVASLPCLVCGRTPSQAHHLKFAQPRALASKPSDEWTVPLCLLHHRALHDVGSEETWWAEQRIDATIEAQRLWHRTQGGGAVGADMNESAE